MTIKPVGKNVLIKRTVQKTVSDGGIVLPGSAKESPKMQGQIQSVGKDVKDFKAGDKVIFPDYIGVLVGKKFIIMEEEKIVAVYED
jgi:chaperonin GroES